jgi:hypothetical protein
MFINQSLADRVEASWPEVYQWLGEKLSLLYEQVAPKLREAMDRHESA